MTKKRDRVEQTRCSYGSWREREFADGESLREQRLCLQSHYLRIDAPQRWRQRHLVRYPFALLRHRLPLLMITIATATVVHRHLCIFEQSTVDTFSPHCISLLLLLPEKLHPGNSVVLWTFGYGAPCHGTEGAQYYAHPPEQAPQKGA